VTRQTEEQLTPAAVVCVDGLGINGLGIVRSLGRRGIPVYVVGVNHHLDLAASSRYCGKKIEIEDVDGDALYHALTILADKSGSRPVLFFDNDRMMNALGPHAEAVEKKFRVTSPLRNMKELSCKRFQISVARSIGLAVPDTWYPGTWDELYAIDTDGRTRFIAKPASEAYPFHKPFKVMTGDNIPQLADRLKARVGSPEGLIIQKYIEGPDSQIYVALGYKSFGTEFCEVITGIKTCQSCPGAGVMAVGRAKDSGTVRRMTRDLISALNYSGIIGVEYKYSTTDGKYYFIEISPRAELFHTLGAKAGFDLPFMAYRDVAGIQQMEPLAIRRDAGHYWICFRSDMVSLLMSRRNGNYRRFFEPYLGEKEWAVYASDDLVPWIRSVQNFASSYISALFLKICK